MWRLNLTGLFLLLQLEGIAGQEREIVATLPGGAKMDFVWVGPGRFWMGTTPREEARLRLKGWWEPWCENERPVREVVLTQGFYIGKNEITQAQWQAVTGKSPWRGYSVSDPQRPAVRISWYAVQRFVHRLNSAVGDSLYRLPTEAEWEYACRAGSATLWSFGNDPSELEQYAWTSVNGWNQGMRSPQAVALKRANPLGVFDLYGNVWEWCADWFGPYAHHSGTYKNPLGPADGSLKVVRGGSYNSGFYARSAARGAAEPNQGYNLFIGARLVRRAKLGTDDSDRWRPY